MAKSKIVDVEAVALSGVTVKRWWRSREVWNAALGIIVSVFTALIGVGALIAPVVSTYLNQLGLSPFRTMVIAVLIAVIIQINQMILKFRSTSMIGNKDDVSIARVATGDGDQTEVGPH